MTPAHLHLMLVHAPVVAPAFALALVLLAAAWLRADAGLSRGALLGAVLTLWIGALGATGAYLSGEEAEEQVEDLVPIDEAAVEEHEERAELALILSWVAAVAGAGAAIVGARTGRPGVAVAVTGAGAAAAMIAMALTGLSAGPIRHAVEIEGAAGASGAASGEAGEAHEASEHDDE
jgi:hypothetical protein